MGAIPPRFETNFDVQQPSSFDQQRVLPEGSTEATSQAGENLETDLPIFCAGGCGEVVGYFARGAGLAGSTTKSNQRLCPACQAARAGNKKVVGVVATNTERCPLERKPSRALVWLSVLQIAIVAIIISGSVGIAMGRVLGIYLAAFGSLAWFVTCFVLRWHHD